MDLGEQHYCINAKDLKKSIEFYSKLDFEMVSDHSDQNWAVMRHNNMILAIFQGHIERNLFNFRGCDIDSVAKQCKERGLELRKEANQESDGSWSAEIVDPDGNHIYFNTYPDEREKWLKDGRLIDP